MRCGAVRIEVGALAPILHNNSNTMCAINGFNFQDKDLILKMNQTTRHRGPDGTGVFWGDGISLGHNRLSIIDLSEAAGQPMKSNDGRLEIVFNGEIYNFRELKKQLPDHMFKTSGDTEVILAAYKKWGRDCVKKFNGIFAFAIWDKEKRELFLARDQIGVKPLYYFWDGKKLIFSSEIKAILEHDVPRVLNKEAFAHYLRVLYVPEPLTMFRGINKLPPATYATLKDGRLETHKYWEMGGGDHLAGDRAEIAKDLRTRIREAVGRQLVSDRPLGIYLSGGIDSSAVLDSVAQIRSNIETFSVGFELEKGGDREKFNQDFYLASRTAKHYGTHHNEVMLSPHDVVELFERSVWHLDEPISNPTIIPMMKLAKFAKEKAAVVLGGDGGDELFGGYDRYRLSLMCDRYQKLPAIARSMFDRFAKLKKLNTPAGVKRFELFMFQKDQAIERAVSGDILSIDTEKFFADKYFATADDRDAKNFTEKLMNVDCQSWLVDFSLMMTDKASMSAGLEVRVPMLDRELVEFAARIPFEYKVGAFDTKMILKDAFRGRLPAFLSGQPKRGWFSPGAKWLRLENIYGMARDIFSDSYWPEVAPLFQADELLKMLDEHRSGKYYPNTLWAIMAFKNWAKRYKISL